MSELSELVNPLRLRASLKRLFSNSWTEIFGELVQNAQRAGATRFEVSVVGQSLFIADNGTGLANLEAFHTLLKLAESSYSEEVMDSQAPLGLGIHSLFAHDKVSLVTFRSHQLELTIETARWWSDTDYYSNWFERVVTLSESEAVSGLQIEITHSDKLRNIENIFISSSQVLGGYNDLLEIHFNGKKCKFTSEWELLNSNEVFILVKTEFLGNQLFIGFSEQSSLINWYGQLVQTGPSPLFFYYKVRQGKPLNLLSPSRRGVIEDQAWMTFRQFVEDQLFNYVLKQEHPSVSQVTHLYQINHARAVASGLMVIRMLELSADIGEVNDIQAGEKRVILNGEAYQFFNDDVVLVHEDGKVEIVSYGLESFITALGLTNACVLENGDASTIDCQTLHWHLEEKHPYDYFYNPGSWSLDGVNAKPLPSEAQVFAFDCAWSSLDCGEFYFGSLTPLQFISKFGWVGFEPDDEDSDREEREESYQASLTSLIMQIRKDCIPFSYTYNDLVRCFSGNTQIAQIQFIIPDSQFQPTGIEVTTTDGRSMTLTFID